MKKIWVIPLLCFYLFVHNYFSNGNNVICGSPFDPSNVSVLSWSPRIMYYPNFLEKWECSYMIRLAGGNLPRSLVMIKDGELENGEERTSSGKFLFNETYSDSIVGKIEDKIAAWSQLPHEHGEFLYYLKYDEKQEYKPHFDSFDPEFLQKQGISVDEAMGESGLRICTVLIYLRAPIEGGETSFPNINLTIPIAQGDAVLFWTHNVDHSWNPDSLHAGMPVIKGEKIILTKWIREKLYAARLPLNHLTVTTPLL